METRVENPELKSQIEEFVIEQLENCELFVNTYGKGYAAQRLTLNFQKLYTEATSKRKGGEYSLGTSGKITLFMKGNDGNLLTFDDLVNKNGLATALHECVHAIFNKTPRECKDSKISCGSGIHEIYQNSELGRGLNEGFTNWVCNKAGMPTMSYASLTNLVNILEIAIGPERIMELGKGNISKNISNLLGMNPKECQVFLSKADAIYNYEDKSGDFSKLASIMRQKAEFEAEKINSPELAMDEKLEKDLQELGNDPLYANLLSNNDYIEFANKNNLKPDLEGSKLKYFEEKQKYYFNKAKEMTQEVQGEIFAKHFMDEIIDTIDSGECSFEKYKKFSKLSNLIFTYGDYKNETLQDFKAAFKDLRKQFFDKAEQDIKESVKNGTLTAEKLNQYRNLTAETSFYDPSDFNSMLSKIMLPENPFAYEWLFNALSGQNKITEIFDYRLFELKNKKGQVVNLFFDTKNDIHFTRFVSIPKTIYAGSEVEDKDSLFDMTLDGLQSMQEIVKNFLSLKDKICQENPNTRLQIVDGAIISTVDGGEPTFYVLDGNEWGEAKVTEFIPQKVHSAKTTSLELDAIDTSNVSENNTDLEPVSKNPLKNIFLAIKRRFFKSEMNFAAANTQTTPATNKAEEDKRKFDFDLRHTEDGKLIETPRIDQNTTGNSEQTQNSQDKEFIE